MSARRKSLGRGLDALLEPESREGLRTIDISRLKPNRLQPRTHFDEAGLDELAASIREQGVVQPLIVTPRDGGDYTIVAGERRWRAAQRAGLAQVPAVVRRVEDDRRLLELALVENLQRADLNPVEEADAYHSLAETFQLDHEEIAHRVGKSRPAVTNALRLLRLPTEILDFLRDGSLTAGQVRPLVPLPVDRALEIAQRAVSEGLSARRIEQLAKGAGSERSSTPKVDPDTARAAERLTGRLRTKVEIRRRGKAGRVILHFHDEEELMRLFDLLSEAAN